MFDPVRICEILNEERVRYVIVGGIATVMHGSSLTTRDLDVVPARGDADLENLARALRRMNARLRTDGDPVEFPIDAEFLAKSSFMLNLVCDFGDLDVAFRPSGPLDGFDGWAGGAVEMSMSDGLAVLVGSLDDIIESKRAAARPKDVAALPLLESLRDQLSE